MKRKVKLLEKHIKVLETLPEQGMGYQIVDINMEEGKHLNKRIVLNSSFLVLEGDELIDPNKIASINLHQG